MRLMLSEKIGFGVLALAAGSSFAILAFSILVHFAAHERFYFQDAFLDDGQRAIAEIRLLAARLAAESADARSYLSRGQIGAFNETKQKIRKERNTLRTLAERYRTEYALTSERGVRTVPKLAASYGAAETRAIEALTAAIEAYLGQLETETEFFWTPEVGMLDERSAALSAILEEADGENRSEFRLLSYRMNSFSVLLVIAVMLGSVVLIAYLYRKVSRPIERLAETARELAEGNWHVRVPAAGADELANLAAAFNEMARKLAELDRTRLEFVSIASHQLKTPLTGVQWVIERLLAKEQMSANAREYLSEARTACHRLAELVDLLLNLSRIEGGGIRVSPRSLELVEFIRKILHEYSAICAKRNIALIFRRHPERLEVITDSNILRNIVQSLISNAIEYNVGGGEVEVSLEVRAPIFRLAVRDTGIGIPQDEQPRIFEKFFRASNAKLVKTDGTGIGLYIAHQAARLLGGEIYFESEELKGTTFVVNLP